MTPRSFRRTGAFTLVELIVVITILAILATIGFLSLQGFSSDAYNATARANVKSVAEALTSEASVSNSPLQTYVSDKDVALYYLGSSTGTVVAVYSGNTVSYASGTYFAGKVDFAALRMDPSKFEPMGKDFLAGVANVSENYGYTVRLRPVFQVAGSLQGENEIAYVEGTYARVAPSDAGGLIRGQSAACALTSTDSGAIMDGKSGCVPYEIGQ